MVRKTPFRVSSGGMAPKSNKMRHSLDIKFSRIFPDVGIVSVTR